MPGAACRVSTWARVLGKMILGVAILVDILEDREGGEVGRGRRKTRAEGDDKGIRGGNLAYDSRSV